MEFISSDTNVWIDFSVIQRIEVPFRLPYTYIMNTDAIEDELLSPTGLRDELLHCGLVGVELELEEFELAESFGAKYIKLSIYDRVALAIAKLREITLLTGDGALRKAAISEGVTVIGTIGVLDQLHDGSFIDDSEYKFCLLELQKHNGQDVRLPKAEITARIQGLR
ncbi:MAG: PIN domain-containing protein [Lentisphaerae bacterium]|jgi:predicted nucleic acid-binding protein|nr:PIN domain-containing protein [Lentisphaerota bacterium]